MMKYLVAVILCFGVVLASEVSILLIRCIDTIYKNRSSFPGTQSDSAFTILWSINSPRKRYIHPSGSFISGQSDRYYCWISAKQRYWISCSPKRRHHWRMWINWRSFQPWKGRYIFCPLTIILSFVGCLEKSWCTNCRWTTCRWFGKYQIQWWRNR